MSIEISVYINIIVRCIALWLLVIEFLPVKYRETKIHDQFRVFRAFIFLGGVLYTIFITLPLVMNLCVIKGCYFIPLAPQFSIFPAFADLAGAVLLVLIDRLRKSITH